ncbi:5941_t:CDS:2, partial [Scutellospora calospora]
LNNNLYISSSRLLVTNKPSSPSTNQINYSLLRIYEDSDDENSYVNVLPVLSRLAIKYLAILAISIPSEKLFSDASFYLSAH